MTITAETITNASGTLIIQADGDFTYLPAAGFTGNAVFNYTVNDNDALGSKSDTGQITINVATPKVWYVDASAAAGGDGTSDNPFNSLAPLNGVTGDGTTNDDVDGAGDIIFLYGGTYTGGIVLEDGQQLISKEHGLTVNGTALEAADGGSVTTINGTVTLAGGVTANNIQGIDFGTVVGLRALRHQCRQRDRQHCHRRLDQQHLRRRDQHQRQRHRDEPAVHQRVVDRRHQRHLVQRRARHVQCRQRNAEQCHRQHRQHHRQRRSTTTSTFTYGGAISDDGNLLVNITGQTGGTKTFNGTLTDGACAGGGIKCRLEHRNCAVNFNGRSTLSTGSGTRPSTSPATPARRSTSTIRTSPAPASTSPRRPASASTRPAAAR